MKFIKQIFLSILFLSLLGIATLFIVVFAYENEVKSYMIRELNKRLKTQVIVDSTKIQLSLLHNFPYASLEFKDIIIMESTVTQKSLKQKRDTLFSSSRIWLQFNLLDLLQKRYIVKAISAENGKMKLHKYTDGTVNWDMWKSEDTASSESSAFKLERFRLDRISLEYIDHKNKTDILLRLNYAIIKGEISGKEYSFMINSNLFINHVKTNNVNYISNQPAKTELLLNAKNAKYTFKDAWIQIADIKIAMEGTYTDSQPSFVDIRLKGKNMNMQSVLSVLPEKYRMKMTDYESEGDFYFSSYIKGKLDANLSPEIMAEFGIRDGSVIQLSTKIVLKQVNMKGKYSAGYKKEFLEINSFSASFIDGNLSGTLRIDNLASPLAKISVRANLPLANIKQFFKIDTLWSYPIESLQGMMQVNMEYKGTFKHSDKYKKEDFSSMLINGEITLENAGMKIKNSGLLFDNIYGSLILNNNNIEVQSFSGKTASSDFRLKGILKNVPAFILTDKDDIDIDASFQSANFNLNEFLLNDAQTTQRDTIYIIRFSPRINFNLSSTIKRLTFRKFEATNISGNFQLHKQKLIGDPITFSTMNGMVTITGMIDNSADSLLIMTCNANLKRLDIKQLFAQMEDFGQNTLTHHHLKGIGTAEVQFASVWKTDLTPDLNRVYARSTLLLEKGELIKFEPLKSLSKYISLSELEQIKFSTLKNEIEIKEQKIFIPKMDIQSSALDLTMQGTHTFNNEIDYRFKVAMADVLFNKARRAKKENNEFGIVEDDKNGKTSLFISMTGTVDNPIIKYDKQGAKQQFKENIAHEKQTLRQILHEEFRLFKKDTAINKKKLPKDEGKFIIKWEDEEKTKTKNEDEDF